MSHGLATAVSRSRCAPSSASSVPLAAGPCHPRLAWTLWPITCSPWALCFCAFGSSNTSLPTPRSWADRGAAGQRALQEKAAWCRVGASVPIPLGPSSCPSVRSGQVASVLADGCFRPRPRSSSPHPSFFFFFFSASAWHLSSWFIEEPRPQSHSSLFHCLPTHP